VRASPGNVRRPCRRRVGVPCLLCSFVYLVDVAGADASVRVCAHLIPQTKKLIMEGRFRGTQVDLDSIGRAAKRTNLRSMAANDESELIAQELSVWGAKNSVRVGNRRFTGVTRILAPHRR